MYKKERKDGVPDDPVSRELTHCSRRKTIQTGCVAVLRNIINRIRHILRPSASTDAAENSEKSALVRGLYAWAIDTFESSAELRTKGRLWEISGRSVLLNSSAPSEMVKRTM